MYNIIKYSVLLFGIVLLVAGLLKTDRYNTTNRKSYEAQQKGEQTVPVFEEDTLPASKTIAIESAYLIIQ